MKDNEIIKAIEYCSSHDDCDLKCPIEKETTADEGCIRTIGRLALDIINRQKAEIEKLEKENESFSCLGMLYSEIKAEARKEFAERLKKDIGEAVRESVKTQGRAGFFFAKDVPYLIDYVLAELTKRKEDEGK